MKSSIIAVASAFAFILTISTRATTILMDFGSASIQTTGQPQTWNNIYASPGVYTQTQPGDITASGATLSLLDTNGAASGITLTVVRSFAQANTSGPTTTTTGYPGSATMDSLYGNVENFASGGGDTANVYPALNFSGFSPLTLYRFTFYASRGVTGDNRETRYTLEGDTTNYVDYQPSANVNNVVTLDMRSDAGGNILWEMGPGPNNNNSVHFSYIGVMQIDTLPKTATTIVVNSSENPSAYGDSVIFTATVQTNLATAGDVAGNVIFKLNGLAFSTNMVNGGTATATNNALPGGTNIITAEYSGDNSYAASTNTLAGGQIVTLSGIAPTIISLPTAGLISYGQILADSILSGGEATNAAAGVSVAGYFTFTTPVIAPDAGSTNVSVTFMPTTPGYIPVSNNITISVSKTTPDLTLPKTSVISPGQTLADSILSGGTATNDFNNAPIEGSFAFTTPSIAPDLGMTNVNVTFTPTDTVNYNNATSTVEVNVTKKIVVYGSSVALGYGSSPTVYYNGSYTNGYAGHITSLLEPQGWTVTNISIGGQVTADGLSRLNPDLIPLNPNFVIIGYSLANEGFVGSQDPAALTNRFISNLATLIPLCRSNGIYPVIGLTYANNGYSSAEYQYGKDVNLILNTWNVPSINLLGALDDGSGHWTSGYYFDALHPNNAGHQEMFYSFVPTLFDAINAGKTVSPHFTSTTNFTRLAQESDATAPITFTPSNVIHSFTVSFRVRSTDNGTIAAVRSGSSYATIEIKDGKLVYVSPGGQEISSSVNVTNGDWHEVSLSCRYAPQKTMFVVDGSVAGYMSEQYAPDQFILGGPGGATGRPLAPSVADFKNWCVYRSAWNEDEAAAQFHGHLQQASMEICAPLADASFTAGVPITNLAQSLSVAMVNTTNLTAMLDPEPPNQLTVQMFTPTSVLLNWTKNGVGETGFVIERRIANSGQSWSDLAVVAVGSSTFTDTGITKGVTYEYRVAALQGNQRSGYSDTAKIALGAHQDILVDFGPNDTANGNFVSNPDYLGQYWNNMYGPGGGSIYVVAGTGLADLITTNNITTTIGLVIGNNFQANGIVNGGLLDPDASLLGNFAVTNATEDYFFTTSAAGAVMTLTNLDPDSIYRLRLFGTRNTSATRTTQYVVTGGNGSFTNILQTSGNNGWLDNGASYYGNNNTIVNVTNIVPGNDNQIQLTLNIVTGGFAYLGAMEITANHPPIAANVTCFRESGTAFTLAISDLLTNVTDLDGDAITLQNIGPSTTGATVTNDAADIYYIPAAGAGSNENDSFTYTVNDGYGGSTTGTINMMVFNQAQPAQIGVTNNASGNGVATIKFFGIPTKNYVVQTATNILGPWLPLSTNTSGAEGYWIFADSNATNTEQYYRLAQP